MYVSVCVCVCVCGCVCVCVCVGVCAGVCERVCDSLGAMHMSVYVCMCNDSEGAPTISSLLQVCVCVCE